MMVPWSLRKKKKTLENQDKGCALLIKSKNHQ